ncbi:MAG: radical SAM protein, partial [Planctomycetales bacterium]|nr:radical SAM protein [Planctomycetales bacterium]
EVAHACRVPISIVTKNALVVRDLDLLREMAQRQLAHVNISITTLDVELARVMEPRTSIPSARLRAIRELSAVGIPMRVMVAPVIPGLNDHEVPLILQQAREAGASDAGYILLRLPLTVEPVFLEWLRRTQPLKAERIEGRIRETRGGKLSDSTWGTRMSGVGEIADQISAMFRIFRQKFGFAKLPALDITQFVPPPPRSGQLRLF